MTKKQKRFVEEYLIDLNATQAAIRAGYSPDTAQQMGSENLSKPVIKNAIDKAIAERSRRTGINQDRVIQEIAKLAFLNPIDVIDMDEATIKGEANRDDTACIASVKVKVIPGEDGNITEREVKTYDKLKALEYALMNIAPSMILHGQKLFGKGLIYFWHKKSETAAPP